MVTLPKMPSSASASAVLIGLEDFRREAARGEELYLHVEGESYKLVATGATASGRSVAWLALSGDVTGMFVAAMNLAYGQQLSRMVANELGLAPAEGKPLLSRVVVQALSMAETAGAVLDGIHFADQLAQGKSCALPPTAPPTGKASA